MLDDIPHSYPTITARDIQAMIKVLRSGQVAQGQEVKKFEERFSQFLHVRETIATSSGTSALHLALLALDVKNGDEVIVPTYVCTALLNAVYYVGAKPRIVDVNYADFNISVSEVKKNLRSKTKVIIVPHTFGLPADLRPLLNLGVPLVEDCAHTIGAQYQGQKVGSWGKLAICSFYATKMMTTGEGGLVISNDLRVLNKIRDLRDYDHKDIYRVRFNYKMTDFQAAMGLSQLSYLSSWIRKRQQIAHAYTQQLRDCPIQLPQGGDGRQHIYYRYVIKVRKSKQRLLKQLKKAKVGCADPVYKALHRYLGLKGFPVAENLAKEAISIPIYPSLKKRHRQHIIKTLRSLLG